MINLIKLILFLGIVYLTIYAVSYYDTKMLIEIYSYQVQVSFFFVCVSSVLFVIIAYLVISLIKNLYSMPRFISSKFQASQNNKARDLILDSYIAILSHGAIDSYKVNALKGLNDYNKHAELIVFINSYNSSQTSDETISRLYSLSQIPNLSLYAHTQLVKLFFKSRNYIEAMKHGKLAFEINKTNEELNLYLINLYTVLGMWEDLEHSIAQIECGSYKIPDNIHTKKNISRDLLALAEYYIQKGDSIKELQALEDSLRYDQENLYSIDKLCKHYINNGHTHEIQDVLDRAFACNPSFDLFVMYKKFSGVNDDVIYDNLATLARPKENIELFLSIGAALGQPDKVNDIRNLNALEN